MAAPTVLRVKARGTALVQDYRRMEAGVRAYIGRVMDASTIDPKLGRGISFKPTDEIVELAAKGEHATEYMKHVLHGDLWAADEETAAYCGVKFDPSFGGSPSAPPAHDD